MELGVLFTMKKSFISLIRVLSNCALIGLLGIMNKSIEESGTS
jgi:hypothetical protein